MKRRQVSMSGAVRLQFRELGKLAIKAGLGEEFVRAARFIIQALQTRPMPQAPQAFGCPQYHLQHLHLLVCVALVPPLAVRFAVSDETVERNGADPAPVYVIHWDALS